MPSRAISFATAVILMLGFAGALIAQDQNSESDGDTASPVMVASGALYSFALLSDGSVWAWGANHLGELGVGDSENRLSPTQIKGLEFPKQIAVTFERTGAPTAALQRNGKVFAWGGILSGSPSQGARIFPSPIELPPVEDVESISVREDSIYALTKDGALWKWHWIGEDTRPAQSAISIPEVFHISGSLALNKSGEIWDMAANPPRLLHKQDGLVQVVHSTTDVHYLALDADGAVWAWGSNSGGQLGIGSMPSTELPTRIDHLPKIVSISAGLEYSLALDENGNIWGWGFNLYGRLGNGSTMSTYVPTQAESLSEIVHISAGWEHSLAIDASGKVWAWGNNKNGQLGIGNTQNSTVPVQVIGLPQLGR